MHALRGTTTRTLAKTVHILKAFVGQLPHSLPRVGDLVLRHSSQDAFPNIIKQCGNGDADAGKSYAECREQSASDTSQRRQTRNRKQRRRGNSGKKGRHSVDVDDRVSYKIGDISLARDQAHRGAANWAQRTG